MSDAFKDRKAVLVYQAGIANLFRVLSFDEEHENRRATRIMQGDFKSCEWFARGLRYAGWYVVSAHANYAGDITESAWNYDMSDAVFRESMNPVDSHIVQPELVTR